jgi:hypothetical protein
MTGRMAGRAYRWCRLVVISGDLAVMALVTLAVGDVQADTRPATQPAPSVQSVPHDASEVKKRIAELGRKSRESLDELLALADRSPESRAEVSKTLENIACQARLTSFVAQSGNDVKGSLLKLGKSHGDIVAGTFSEDANSIIGAMESIAWLPRAEYAHAEALVIRGLESPDCRVKIAATLAACRKESSSRIADALVKMLTDFTPDDWSYKVEYLGLAKRTLTDLTHLLVWRTSEALGVVGGDETRRKLMFLLRRQSDRCVQKNAIVCSILVKRGAKTAVPELAAMLRGGGGDSQYSLGLCGRRSSLAEADPILWAVVLLTGQSLSEYGFETHVPFTVDVSPIYGFGSPKDRDKAIAKFGAWWKENGGRFEKKGKQKAGRGEKRGQGNRGTAYQLNWFCPCPSAEKP